MRGQKEKKKNSFSFSPLQFHSLLLLFLCFASETLFCPLFFSSSSGKGRGGEEKARNGKRGGVEAASDKCRGYFVHSLPLPHSGAKKSYLPVLAGTS